MAVRRKRFSVYIKPLLHLHLTLIRTAMRPDRQHRLNGRMHAKKTRQFVPEPWSMLVADLRDAQRVGGGE
jgi:hypothetical protein